MLHKIRHDTVCMRGLQGHAASPETQKPPSRRLRAFISEEEHKANKKKPAKKEEEDHSKDNYFTVASSVGFLWHARALVNENLSITPQRKGMCEHTRKRE